VRAADAGEGFQCPSASDPPSPLIALEQSGGVPGCEREPPPIDSDQLIVGEIADRHHRTLSARLHPIDPKSFSLEGRPVHSVSWLADAGAAVAVEQLATDP
jgi:hypothetical protein